ncbi:fimbrial protein [Enterobacter quasiroggenkampii]|uniref:fimbrial protein n=1 Tax=Enterobacter quasiroggenkampii TaxID=2497436 RepID=UPI001F354AC3|nr:fimbrial protein [Enterobacter quasiroggenkampii]
MKNIKCFFRFLIFVALFCISKISFAACSYGDNGQVRPATPIYNFGTVVVQRDAPVGTIMKSVSVTYSPGGTTLGCDTNWTQVAQQILFPNLSAISNVYQTNLNGVGIRVSRNGKYFNYTSAVSASTYVSTSTPLIAELVKTASGQVVSGTLASGTLTKISISESPGYYIDTYLGSGSVLSVACSITTPSLTFPIGDVLASRFGSTVGTIPANANNTQNLGLNCDAGANINVALNGTQNPDVGTTSVLALTNQGSADVAKGVGVQLLYNGSPLILNSRIVLKTSSGGQETFPITARYYQTKTAVTTGKANASATLDLTYQ